MGEAKTNNVMEMTSTIHIEPEVLNLEYHKRRLTVLALNKADSKDSAAKLLGIGKRTLDRWMYIYDIYFDGNEYKLLTRNSGI